MPPSACFASAKGYRRTSRGDTSQTGTRTAWLRYNPVTYGPRPPTRVHAPSDARANLSAVCPRQPVPAEFTAKAVVLGAIFGLIFGASTVYLGLRAGP